jgi:3-hydroxyacyl-CoA dehydrogenase
MTTETSAPIRVKRVVVLGANGAMGAGSAAMFASGGCDVTLVARDLGKCEGALAQIQSIAKSERIADGIESMTYSDGMETVLADADLIFECLAEDMELKREIFAQVDAARPPDAIVATVSSGLSIQGMCEGRSEGFRKHFAGIHLYNPPHVMIGVEVIPHPDMDAGVVGSLTNILNDRFGRQVIVCADMPAFAGNRIGFKVLNEVAQLAEKHGVEMMDTLIGPYTGRAMAPLATIDLVGWDVHKAIVDNVYDNVQDEARSAFVMPSYMVKLVERGHMGNKTPELGGFFRRVVGEGRLTEGSHGRIENQVLDAASGKYVERTPAPTIPFVEEIKDLHRRGRYDEGVQRFMLAEGAEADLARKVILGYISYALNRVGEREVVQNYDDVDRIMTSGFNWAPPSGYVDLIGARQAKEAMERYDLAVPAIVDAAVRGDIPTPLFRLPFVNPGRYFSG